jgi:flotillin
MDQAQMIGIGLGLGFMGLGLLIVFLKTNIVLCQPNELVVIAGRQRRNAEGKQVGYRVIRGGRGFKMPLVESVARLPLTTVPIEISLHKVMCAGMIPVDVEGRANVKLAGRPEMGMDEAIERFLGKGPDAVVKSAQQTLAGALRGVIATMTPEDANAQRLEVATKTAERAREDLRRLGIVLDFFLIEGLTDHHGYLEAIGRKRNAHVQKDARIAEATSEAEARKIAAEQKKIGRQAEIQSEIDIVTRENELAVHRANLAKEANDAEARSKMASAIAKAEEEIALEERRVSLSEKRNQADVLIPAQAKSEAKKALSEGYASRILEEGRATAQAVELMRKQWPDKDTRDLFLIQLMPTMMDKATRVISDNLRIDKLTILDGGDGEGVPGYVKNLTNSAVTMLEQVKNATGVDLAALAEKYQTASSDLPKDLKPRD